jgi:hypothetical protein
MRLLILLLVAAISAAAHNGPPFPIITDLRMGPCVVSLWTHPDIGVGTFFVVANPAPGMTLPKDLKFEISVHPVARQLKERFFRTSPRKENGQTHYYAWVPFDRQEVVHVNLYLRSSMWNGDTSANVEVTPVGLGAWDLLLFSLPFAGVGFLWFMGMKRKRLRRSQQAAASH